MSVLEGTAGALVVPHQSRIHDFVIRVQAEPPRSAHLPQTSISTENFDRIVGLTAEVIRLPDVESACVDRSIAEQ